MNHTRSSVMSVINATGVWKMVDISLRGRGQARPVAVGVRLGVWFVWQRRREHPRAGGAGGQHAGPTAAAAASASRNSHMPAMPPGPKTQAPSCLLRQPLDAGPHLVMALKRGSSMGVSTSPSDLTADSRVCSTSNSRQSNIMTCVRRSGGHW